MAAAEAEATQGTTAAAATAAAAVEAEDPRETRKLFVGGVPSAAKEADLVEYFARFGEVRSAMVMRDRETGHGRGFGFVEFEAEDAAAKALGDGDQPRHYICGRQVDVKRARTRPPRNHYNHQPAEDNNVVSYESKKVFVGGLRDNVNEEEFKTYFETFGTVTDAVVIYDSLTNRSRGFGFVTFDSEEAVNKVMQQSFHSLNGTKVEAKIAIPKDEQYYRSRGRGRPFGFRGPANYEGQVYQPYNGYGLYGGYMPQPVPTQPFYPAPYFGMPYGSGYPSQGVMTNVPAMMPRRAPQHYGVYPQMHPGFNFVPRGGFEDPAAANFQNGFNGGSNNKKDQTAVDTQDVVNTSSIETKLEHMKLGSQ